MAKSFRQLLHKLPRERRERIEEGDGRPAQAGRHLPRRRGGHQSVRFGQTQNMNEDNRMIHRCLRATAWSVCI